MGQIMNVSPFDIIKHISEKSDLEFDMKDYAPWMINKGLSNMLDTIFFAEVVNRYSHLDKDIQYVFYKTAVPKGRRFGKWHKAEAINSNVELIMKRYHVNRQVAEQYLKVMSEAALQQLQETSNEGGRK